MDNIKPPPRPYRSTLDKHGLRPEPTIADTFLEMIDGFRKFNLEPPEVLIFNRKTGYRLGMELKMLPIDSYGIELPVTVPGEDGFTWMQMEVVGIKVRWPAQLSQMGPGNDYTYV